VGTVRAKGEPQSVCLRALAHVGGDLGQAQLARRQTSVETISEVRLAAVAEHHHQGKHGALAHALGIFRHNGFVDGQANLGTAIEAQFSERDHSGYRHVLFSVRKVAKGTQVPNDRSRAEDRGQSRSLIG
jgi:hypothetical protein